MLLQRGWPPVRLRRASPLQDAKLSVGLRVLVPDVYAPWLVPTLDRFSEVNGVPVDLNVQPLSAVLPTILADAKLPASGQHAVWLQTTLSTQHLADTGMAVDISHLVESSQSSLQWPDIFQLFRLQLASYRGTTYALPLDGSTLYMVARRDVFDRLGQEAPMTWQGLVDFVAAYPDSIRAAAAGLEGNAEQLPPYAVCLPLGASCRQLSLLQAIWSSIAQTQGFQQGVHFDTATLEPLLDTPAGREAFRVAVRLLAAAAPAEPEERCSAGSLAFARGRCALVVAGFVPQMRMLILPEYNATISMGTLKMHPVPGSSVVWARDPGGGTGGELRACTRQLCPHATNRTVGNGSTALVNHTPLSPGSNLAGVVNSAQPLIVQHIAYALLEYLGSPDRYGPGEPALMLQTVAPVRERVVSTEAVALWAAAGYNVSLMRDVMPAISFTRLHPNRAWDLRMPYHMVYYEVLDDVLGGLRNGSVRLDEDLQYSTRQQRAASAPWGPVFSIKPCLYQTPVRERVVSTEAVALWAAAGYNVSLMRDVMPAISFTRLHPNRAWDLRMPYHMVYYEVLDDVLGGLRNGSVRLDEDLQYSTRQQRAASAPSTGPAAALALVRASRRLLQAAVSRQAPQPPQGDGASPPAPQDPAGEPPAAPPSTPPIAVLPPKSLSQALQEGQARLAAYYDPQVFLLKYLHSLDIHQVSSSGTDARAPKKGFAASLAAALAVSALVLVGFVAGGALLWWRRRRRRRRRGNLDWVKRLGKPGTAPVPVALCVTDIQDSTSLWEALPAAVMSEAVRLHHAAVRRLTCFHGGYESSTEGDSFILAFASVKQAAAFALDLQAQLLQQPWPAELLRQPLLAPPASLPPPGHAQAGRPSFSSRCGAAAHDAAVARFSEWSTTSGPGEEAAEDGDGGAVGVGDSGDGLGAPSGYQSLLPHPRMRPPALPPMIESPLAPPRGLRVRVGISWAVPSAAELQYNTAAARMVYGGPCVAAAKALADMAAGGQVVMSAGALAELEAECGAGPGGKPPGAMILHMGTYALPRPHSSGQRGGGSLALGTPGGGASGTGAVASGALAGLTGAIPQLVLVGTGISGSGGPTSATGTGLGIRAGTETGTGAAADALGSGRTASKTPAPPAHWLSWFYSPHSETSSRQFVSSQSGSALVAAVPPAPPPPPHHELRAVYWLTSPALSPRLAFVPPLRVPSEATPLYEVYGAPVGRLSYAVVQLPAVPVLLAWSRDVAEEALRLFADAATATLQRLAGRGSCYMLPCGAERWKARAAFANAAAAVWWALNLRGELLAAPWPQELLSHELCEVVEAPTAVPDPRVAGTRALASPLIKRSRRRSLTSCLAPAHGAADAGHGELHSPPAAAAVHAAAAGPRPSLPPPEASCSGNRRRLRFHRCSESDLGPDFRFAFFPPATDVGVGHRTGLHVLCSSSQLAGSHIHLAQRQEVSFAEQLRQARRPSAWGSESAGGSASSRGTEPGRLLTAAVAAAVAAPPGAPREGVGAGGMRAGVCSGPAEWFLQDATHSLAYTGRPVSAAAKLAAAAASGQVLCDEATQQEVLAEQMWAAGVEEAVGPGPPAQAGRGASAAPEAPPEDPSAQQAGLGMPAAVKEAVGSGGREQDAEAAAAVARPQVLAFAPALDGSSSTVKKKILSRAFVCRVAERGAPGAAGKGAAIGASAAPPPPSSGTGFPRLLSLSIRPRRASTSDASAAATGSTAGP
ncbi:hypothetical protein GPECTOR_3g515 [Gonium pectorale]|uniref:Uncharacterized protein n=1 Tax=Gonium pectorale TaxID=33097 RepID=A0A150GZV1_GONPE|nr:hypothetical protein GPECTOR_3g515 [Gonium pectorale]|eukprot:KXZ55389.1 hypothetical protein GPECTOR_3g515 [Gonium pectorale]